MVTARLDVLVRALGTASRRDGLRMLATAAMGGPLAWLDPATTGAKKKGKNKNKKKCKRGKKKCGKKCILKSQCCAVTDCPKGSGQICVGDACSCPPGEE